MRCEVARELIPLYVAGELPEDERRALEDHLATCAACRRELARERRVQALLDEAAESQVPVPSSLSEAWREELEREGEGRPSEGRGRWLVAVAGAVAAALALWVFGSLLPGAGERSLPAVRVVRLAITSHGVRSVQIRVGVAGGVELLGPGRTSLDVDSLEWTEPVTPNGRTEVLVPVIMSSRGTVVIDVSGAGHVVHRTIHMDPGVHSVPVAAIALGAGR